MRNIFFKEDTITKNDLFFICYMVERVARKIHQPNAYVIDAIGYENLVREISLAEALHCENPEKIEDDWIDNYKLKSGTFHIEEVNKELVNKIPSATQIGKVYSRLILQTLEEGEDFIQGMIKVYHSEIAPIIDDYNTSAYYEPSYILKKAYYAGNFNAI
ncbi:MAG: hypothetical protein NC412_04970 [Roseburia sp.]|nr:hypothetical protein [Roseburia sp.]MCM1279056.1 hypothetical protein [Robinsoniella sp.]